MRCAISSIPLLECEQGRDYRRQINWSLKNLASASAAVWSTAAIGHKRRTLLKLAGAIRITSGKFGAMDTERGHEGAARFLGAIPANSTPLRITENAHFVREHREVAPDAWKLPKVGSPANCNACHADADQGTFSERNCVFRPKVNGVSEGT